MRLSVNSQKDISNIMRNRIRNITQEYIDQSSSQTHANHSKLALFLRCLISLIFVSSCIYNIGERIAYYLQSPIGVSVYLNEQKIGDFPALFLTSFTTKEFQNYVMNLSKSEILKNYHRCGLLIEKYISYKGSDVEKLWELMNSISIISDAYIKKSTSINNQTADRLVIKPKSHFYGVGASSFSSQYYEDENLPYGDGSTRFVVELKNHPNTTKFCFVTFIIIGFNLKNQNGIPVFTIWPLDATLSAEAIITIQKYEVLNTKKQPCTSFKALSDCEYQCFLKYFPESNCRLPFDLRDLPYCNTSVETGVLYSKTLKLFANILPSRECGCPGVCDTTVLKPHLNFDIEKRQSVEMYVGSKYIRTMIEKNIYDAVSLLCDIGGIMGLYLGLSCLSIIDIINNTCFKIYKRVKNRNSLTQSLHRRVMLVMASEGVLQYRKVSKRTSWYRKTSVGRPWAIIRINAVLGKFFWFMLSELSPGRLCEMGVKTGQSNDASYTDED